MKKEFYKKRYNALVSELNRRKKQEEPPFKDLINDGSLSWTPETHPVWHSNKLWFEKSLANLNAPILASAKYSIGDLINIDFSKTLNSASSLSSDTVFEIIGVGVDCDGQIEYDTQCRPLDNKYGMFLHEKILEIAVAKQVNPLEVRGYFKPVNNFGSVDDVNYTTKTGEFSSINEELYIDEDFEVLMVRLSLRNRPTFIDEGLKFNGASIDIFVTEESFAKNIVDIQLKEPILVSSSKPKSIKITGIKDHKIHALLIGKI